MKETSSELRVSILALVVSLLAAAFTGLQWKAALDTKKEVHEDADRALKVGQRAFVGTEAWIKFDKQSPDKDLITFKVNAGGQTPAVNVQLAYYCEFGNIGGYESQKEDSLRSLIWEEGLGESEGATVLLPGSSEEHSCYPHRGKARSTKTGVLLVGTIKYEDIFTNHHTTRFCYLIQRGTSEDTSTKMQGCEHGNQVD